MHQQKSKRRVRTQLTFVYFVMSLAVVASVAVLMLVILGYRFNRIDGKVEQGGLVQFASKPAGADVTLDSVRLAYRTPSKITATAGDHTFIVAKNGYNTWRKTATVKPGGVLWLNYARLLPASLSGTNAMSLTSTSSLLASPDKKMMAVLEDAGSPVLTTLSLNDPAAKPVTLTIPVSTYTAPSDGISQSFQLVEWSDDNRRILIKHTYGEQVEYLLVDTKDIAAIQNISSLLGMAVIEVFFRDGTGDYLYALTATHEVRLVNLSARTVGSPLLTNVSSVAQFDQSTLVYDSLADVNGAYQTGYLTVGSAKPRVVRTVTGASTAPHLALGRYYNANYALIASAGQTEILTGDLPASDSSSALSWKHLATLAAANEVGWMGFSPGENRFVFVQKGAEVKTFDLELLAPGDITIAEAIDQPISWLDGYHVVATAHGTTSMMDFDGTNTQTITTQGVADLPVVISQNDDYIYYCVRNSGALTLVRAKLAID